MQRLPIRKKAANHDPASSPTLSQTGISLIMPGTEFESTVAPLLAVWVLVSMKLDIGTGVLMVLRSVCEWVLNMT